jgi:hypothetical protein
VQTGDAELHKVVEQGVLPVPVAIRYLTLYLGAANWADHINSLWTRFVRQNGVSKAELQKKMKKTVACAMLLPTYDRKTLDRERPENLLHRVSLWDQFKERDWFEAFQQVVAHDLQIKEWRKQALMLGIIDPVEDAVYTRQAFNWLFENAEASGCISPETRDDIVNRHKNMVKAYGGAVISNIFLRHEDALKPVLNWRTGYFFERAIFDVYTSEQVLKIKRAELAKTNGRLVKRVKVDV